MLNNNNNNNKNNKFLFCLVPDDIITGLVNSRL